MDDKLWQLKLRRFDPVERASRYAPRVISRPAKNGKCQVGVAISAEMSRRIDAICDEAGISRANWMRAAIIAALESR